jgi:hypothetical protein
MKYLSPDSDGGGAPAENPPAPSPQEAPHNAPPPSPAPPPAAQTVETGDKTEKEVKLAKELEDERAARKKVELDNAQLQDELHRATSPAVPAPRQRPSCKRGPLGVRTS